MLYAERGNRVKQISENDIDKYVNQGYKVITDNGAVIKDTVPTDITVLKTAYVEFKAKIDELTAENTQLKIELEKAKPKVQPKVEAVQEAPAEQEVPVQQEVAQTEAPKKSRKKTVTADAE